MIASVRKIDLENEEFIRLVRKLHDQFMRGEIPQGRMAEKLGIGRADLIHLLDAMGLQVTSP